MFKKILLSLLAIASTMAFADNIRFSADVENQNVEFFYGKQLLSKSYPIDECSSNLLTYLQDEDQSYYDFSVDRIKEVDIGYWA